ncbi:MAG: hydrogenase maturation protease [Actinomycetota bacterium]
MSAAPRILVAGCGNVFLADDAFGVEVATRLQQTDLPEGVVVRDTGIRGVHLVYELLDGWDTVIIVDASPRGEAPGTVSLIEPDPDADAGDATLLDAHGMNPDAVLAMVGILGGEIGRILVVACEPAEITERIGLSPVVAGAVDGAVTMVRDLVGAQVGTGRGS